MLTTDITIADFRSRFVRDFDYAPAGAAIQPCQDLIYDADIEKAYGMASILFPTGLWSNDTEFKTAYLLLSAHCMVTDIQTAAGGIASTGLNPTASRSVGAVSESYDMPDWATKSRTLAPYLATRYGQQYLMLLKPRMIGGFAVAAGATTPY